MICVGLLLCWDLSFWWKYIFYCHFHTLCITLSAFVGTEIFYHGKGHFLQWYNQSCEAVTYMDPKLCFAIATIWSYYICIENYISGKRKNTLALTTTRFWNIIKHVPWKLKVWLNLKTSRDLLMRLIVHRKLWMITM